jgi:ferredoxin-NADP reductase
MPQNNNREFVLISKKNEAENITALSFRPVDNLDYKFIPGQYVNIKPQTISGHGKSYTISSLPTEKNIVITIKRKGEVSSAILDTSIGDKLFFDGPYGYFYPEGNSGDLVMLAGGIGITPFYSIIKDRLKSKSKNNIILFYSNKTLKETPFLAELKNLEKDNLSLKVVNVLTQEDIKNPLIQEYSRINEKMLKKYINIFEDKRYYICGSIQFVNAMWKLLKAIGVSEDLIFTESFY